MGARCPQTPRIYSQASAADSGRSSVGGQHTLTLFGIPGERSTATRQPVARTSRYSPEALAAREEKAASDQTRAFYARLVAKYPASSPKAAAAAPVPSQAMLLARLRSEEAERHAYDIAAAGDYPTDYSGPCALEVSLALES